MPGPYIRTFWTVEGKIDKDGHPIEYPTEAAARAQSSAGGIAGTGIGAGFGPVPAATPPAKVTEVMTEDGEYVQTVEGPDGQPQEISRGVDKARLDLYKARQDAAAAAAKTAAPDKPTEVGGKLVRVDPVTGKPEVVYSPEPKRTAPAFEPGAPRPGQKTDLRAIKMQYDACVAQLTADTTLTDEAYRRGVEACIATHVTPAVEAAVRETNEEADRQRARQEEADRQSAAQEARAASAAVRAAARESRADTTAERTEARQFAEFQQTAGQNAVSNALALLPYQTNPKFLEQFTAGLGVLSRGGGVVNFTPDAFQVPLPDLNALAQAGAERAAALYRSAGGVPVAPRTAGAVAPGPEALASAPMAVPPPRTSMPGAPGEPLYPRRPEPGFASGQGYAY